MACLIADWLNLHLRVLNKPPPYEAADIIRQTATLCWGLIKYHPWIGSNKRTATALMRIFLSRNQYRLTSTTEQNVEMVLAVESDQWGVETIESWLREHTTSIEP